LQFWVAEIQELKNLSLWQRHPAQELSAAVVVKTRKADNKVNV